MESATPTKPSPPRSEVSPIALIGFGAILALASAAYPWYLLGSPAGGDADPQTLGTLLQKGWRLFPGIPLALITLSTVVTSIVAVIQRLSQIRAHATLISGFVTLFSAAWLWQGYSSSSSSSSSAPSVPPELGAALITIGAIILVVGGIWILHTVEQGRAAKKSSESTVATPSDSPQEQRTEE